MCAAYTPTKNDCVFLWNETPQIVFSQIWNPNNVYKPPTHYLLVTAHVVSWDLTVFPCGAMRSQSAHVVSWDLILPM